MIKILNKKIFNHFLVKMRYRFLFYGILNLIITFSIIQILLLLIPTFIATFIGQLINFLIGFYLYSFKVFNVNKYSFTCFLKYIFLNIVLWNMNWIFIQFFFSYGFSKNIVALFLVPFLASISYLSQKYLIFYEK